MVSSAQARYNCKSGDVWLVDKYRLRLELQGERDDGQKLADLVADFRHNFHVSLLVALVQGHADMLTTAGNIFRKGLHAPVCVLHYHRRMTLTPMLILTVTLTSDSLFSSVDFLNVLN